MKELYLVRHAKSSWDFPNLSDHDRPLNGRGKRNAPEMGKRLKSLGILPDLLISSTAKRAYKTAKAIADEIGYSTEKIIVASDIFHASIENILDIVNDQLEETKSLMLFGHNPGFTWFANSFGVLEIGNIPTAGIVAFEVTKPWKDVTWGDGSMLFFDYPKKGSDN